MTTTVTPVPRVRMAGPGWWLSNVATVTGRNLHRLVRVPTLIAFATIQPILFVLLFTYAWGGAIHPPGVDRYIDYALPGIWVLAIAFGASQTGVAIADDLATGMIDRFRALPMARSGVLAGRTGGACRAGRSPIGRATHLDQPAPATVEPEPTSARSPTLREIGRNSRPPHGSRLPRSPAGQRIHATGWSASATRGTWASPCTRAWSTTSFVRWRSCSASSRPTPPTPAPCSGPVPGNMSPTPMPPAGSGRSAASRTRATSTTSTTRQGRLTTRHWLFTDVNAMPLMGTRRHLRGVGDGSAEPGGR
jgi:hypothetical protein